MNSTTRQRPASSALERLRSISPVATLAVLIAVAGCGKGSDSSAPAAPEASAGPRTAPIAATAPASTGGASTAPIAMPVQAGPADAAWNDLEKAFHTPPQPPESWATNKPTREEIATFQKSQGAAAEKIADQAKDFYTKYPADPRATEARDHERELLDASVKLGHTNALARLETLEKARLDDPKTSEDDRFALRATAAQRKAQALAATSEVEARASFEESARALIKEFPKRDEPYQMLLSLASDAPAEKARAIAQSLSSTNTPEAVREAASAMLRKFDLVGKPVDIKFTAVDGREIDLAKLRGKVVLIDFWATWCGPCIRELPNVKAAYSKLNPKGFEILGISFDQKKEDLTKLVEKEQMTWPQYFDGKGWGNEFGRRFGIDGIPAMWLVDKKGNLVDLEARDGLEEKVTKLLAEEVPAK